MMRYSWIVAALLIFAFGSSCNQEQAVRIMPLGDSITAGLTVIGGVHHYEGGYRRRLETLLEGQHLNFDFVGSQTDPDTAQLKRKNHEGHSGWRIEDLDGDLDSWIPAAQPDVVLLLAGANDILTQRDLENAPDRLMTLIDHIQRLAPEAWIFASSILPIHDPLMNDQVHSYNESIEERVLARELRGEKIRWVDMNGTSGLTDSFDDLPDGLHPAAPGYDKMAEVWLKKVVPTFW